MNWSDWYTDLMEIRRTETVNLIKIRHLAHLALGRLNEQHRFARFDRDDVGRTVFG